MQLPEESLTFEESEISNAIMRVQALRERAKPGSAPEEFYQTMEEVFTVFEGAYMEMRNNQRAYAHLVCRIELMEKHLLAVLKINEEKNSICQSNHQSAS